MVVVVVVVVVLVVIVVVGSGILEFRMGNGGVVADREFLSDPSETRALHAHACSSDAKV